MKQFGWSRIAIISQSENLFTFVRWWCILILSYSIHYESKGLFFPKYHLKTNIIFTLWHLGSVRCKNAFKLLKKIRKYIFYWLTDLLTIALNLILNSYKATDLISSYQNHLILRCSFLLTAAAASMLASHKAYFCSPFFSSPPCMGSFAAYTHGISIQDQELILTHGKTWWLQC